MTLKTKAVLLADVANKIIDNSNGRITAAILRAMFGDFIDSFATTYMPDVRAACWRNIGWETFTATSRIGIFGVVGTNVGGFTATGTIGVGGVGLVVPMKGVYLVNQRFYFKNTSTGRLSVEVNQGAGVHMGVVQPTATTGDKSMEINWAGPLNAGDYLNWVADLGTVDIYTGGLHSDTTVTMIRQLP